MMSVNFEPSVVENAEKGEQNEIALDEHTLRAQIAALDAKIEFYEGDIEKCGKESAEMLAEVQVLTAQ